MLEVALNLVAVRDGNNRAGDEVPPCMPNRLTLMELRYFGESFDRFRPRLKEIWNDQKI